MEKILVTTLLLLFGLSLVSCSNKNADKEIAIDDIDVEISEEQDKSFKSYSYDYYEKEMKRITYDYCMSQKARYDIFLEYTEDVDKYIDGGIKFVEELDKCLKEIGKDYLDVGYELKASGEETIKLAIIFTYIQYKGDLSTDFRRARDFHDYEVLLDKYKEKEKAVKVHHDEVYDYYVKMHPNATEEELAEKRRICDDNIEKELESIKNEVEEMKDVVDSYREDTILDDHDIKYIGFMKQYV